MDVLFDEASGGHHAHVSFPVYPQVGEEVLAVIRGVDEVRGGQYWCVRVGAVTYIIITKI